ncbi:hypothetical protein BJ508DRAFT_346028 [Ascobolus immersus RN42]|uniref:Apple domain-containing protein n=1 Tax=Ascobolus immersus RN42 TaxID=1160509 RepID=A0A3N4I7P6_ASCIM|nr:hypothetical protein BJ508DRAFT_346028 [Ascobolus immersus RN42]
MKLPLTFVFLAILPVLPVLAAPEPHGGHHHHDPRHCDGRQARNVIKAVKESGWAGTEACQSILYGKVDPVTKWVYKKKTVTREGKTKLVEVPVTRTKCKTTTLINTVTDVASTSKTVTEAPEEETTITIASTNIVSETETLTFTESVYSDVVVTSTVEVPVTTTTTIVVLQSREAIPTSSVDHEKRHSSHWYNDLPRSLRPYNYDELRHACSCIGVKKPRAVTKTRTSTKVSTRWYTPTRTVTKVRATTVSLLTKSKTKTVASTTTVSQTTIIPNISTKTHTDVIDTTTTDTTSTATTATIPITVTDEVTVTKTSTATAAIKAPPPHDYRGCNQGPTDWYGYQGGAHDYPVLSDAKTGEECCRRCAERVNCFAAAMYQGVCRNYLRQSNAVSGMVSDKCPFGTWTFQTGRIIDPTTSSNYGYAGPCHTWDGTLSENPVPLFHDGGATLNYGQTQCQ